MRRTTLHSLIAWLCLFSFGVDMAIHAITPFGVSAGGGCFAQVCQIDNRGAPCQHHDEDGLPPGEHEPCPDSHDSGHHLLAQSKPNSHSELTLPPVTFVLLPPLIFDLPGRLIRPTLDLRVRPPDAVARLRTVVMMI